MDIASCVVDTNVLLRITRRADPQHQLIVTALTQLTRQGTALHYTHQNIAELWNVMTREQVQAVLEFAAQSAEAPARSYTEIDIPFN